MNITKPIMLAAAFFGIAHSSYGVKVDTLFAPDDRPTTRLIKEIDETSDKILAAIYYLSDQKIIDALIRAHNRKVEVRIISDAVTSTASYSKVHQLMQHGIPVFVPNLKRKPTETKAPFFRYPLMHHKFAVFGKKKLWPGPANWVSGRRKVWTGSFNWTIGANAMNSENVVIIEEDDTTHATFHDKFYEMERNCIPFIPEPTKQLIVTVNSVIAQA